METINNKDEIFEKDIETFDPITGEKIIKAITEEELYNKINKDKEDLNILKTKDNKKNKIIIIISILLLFIILIVSALVVNKFKEKTKIETLLALKNTLNIPRKDIDEVFGISKFNKTIENKNYTLNIREDITNLGIGLEVMSNNNGNKYFNISALGQNVFDTIIDKTDIYIFKIIIK